MKKIPQVFGVLLILLSYQTMAQSRHKPLVMLSLGCGPGTQVLGTASLDLITPSDYFFSLGGQAQSKVSPHVPRNYHGGIGTIFSADPRQYSVGGTARFGKVLKNGSNYRLVLSGGLTVGRFSEPVNFVAVPQDPFFNWGANYTYTRVRKTVVGVLLTPTVQVPLSRGFEVSATLLADLNNGPDSVLGLLLGFEFGRLKATD